MSAPSTCIQGECQPDWICFKFHHLSDFLHFLYDGNRVNASALVLQRAHQMEL